MEPPAVGVDDAVTDGPRPVVLVVDDHHGSRAFATNMLEKAGFAVSVATSGAEATEVAAGLHPDLVLLDVQLPDVDGFEVALRLAQKEPRTVVVLTSTREAHDYGGRVASSPAAGFVPKDQLSVVGLRSFLIADTR